MMKKIRLIIIVIILMTFNILYSFVTKEEKIYNANISSGVYTNVGGMTNDFLIEQSFHCDYKNLSEISIRFATFDRSNAGNIAYELTDVKTGNIVVSGNIDTSKIVNNEFNNIKFNKISDSKDKEYILTLMVSDVVGEDLVTVYKTDDSKSAGELVVNGKKQDNTAIVLSAICKKVFDVETCIVLICFEIYIYLFLKLLYKYLA